MDARAEPGTNPGDRQAEVAVDAAGERPVPRDVALGVSVAMVAAGVLWVVLVVVYLAMR